MLVLTRKTQEKIRIGDGITITVIKTKGKSVRLGIEAPADVSVLRGELCPVDDKASDHTPTPAESRQARDPAGKNGPRTEDVDSTDPNVCYTRTPRGDSTQSRVQSILPKTLGEPGPLREMMRKS